LTLYQAEALGPIYDDHPCADLFPRRGPPAEAPARRALVTGLLDQGDTAAPVLVDRQQADGITIVGPVAAEPSWQAQAGEGCDQSPCLVEWDRHVGTCPAGQQRSTWWPATSPQNGLVWAVRFARQDGPPCRYRARCPTAQQESRLLGLQACEPYEALQATRGEMRREVGLF
jgi:transposase